MNLPKTQLRRKLPTPTIVNESVSSLKLLILNLTLNFMFRFRNMESLDAAQSTKTDNPNVSHNEAMDLQRSDDVTPDNDDQLERYVLTKTHSPF